MGTVPVTPANPNQTSGAKLTPLQYASPASPLSQVVSTAVHSTMPGQTGVGASTAGQPFGGMPTTLPTSTNAPTNPIGSGINWQDGSNTVTGDFKDTYGSGTGKALTSVLSNLGTATDSAVQATNQGILQAANDQYANILSQEAARGISPDSSSHALAAGDFNAKVNQTIAQTDAGLQLSDLQTLIGVLQDEGKGHGPDSSFMDSFGDVLGLVGSGANALLSGGVGGGSGTLSSILSGLAML
jgi:hypothetical protein